MGSYRSIVKNDAYFMSRCLELAKKGLGETYPNPLVGCVIVYKNRIISEGWHRKSGKEHAESEAIKRVEDKNILKESTLYVNLEPCGHYGKTNPCADLIVKMKIPRIVIGCIDPNKKVNGKGIYKLKQENCHVTLGVLEKKCINLNKRFFTFHKKKRPYIILKWAESEDGFIAPKPNREFWLTNSYSKQIVHKLRSEENSILIGVQTVINDNPKLTTRLWSGNNPKRIVIDPNDRIPDHSNVKNQSAETFILKKKNKSNSFKSESIKFINPVKEIISFLYKKKVQSVIVEGGAKTISSFIDEKIWDEALVFKTNVIIEKGIKAPIIKMKEKNKTVIKEDTLFQFLNP
ncbi:MAG: bifunctional diaminohydroxyphosphoribosylaminopyrimidine deaminase/5-amino-6-(5-phosphoribosylamino)uracil reductase RibD [Bacteroidota bacterium]|nr:bifunctional diaminohydroxyphosphoribosylaminopyrimidine deaminase/5-amino-6-(5-phosphoribosylamino)uracil reductase RibD [Bacteroidota bacterium]